MKKMNLTDAEVAMIKARRVDKKDYWGSNKDEPIMKRLGIFTYDDFEKVERSFAAIKWFLEQIAEQRGVEYVKSEINGLFTADELEFMTGWTYCEDPWLYEVRSRVTDHRVPSIVDTLKPRRPVKTVTRNGTADRTVTLGEL